MTFQSKFCSRDQSALSEATDRPVFLFQRKMWSLIQIPDGYTVEDGSVYQTLAGHVDDLIEQWHSSRSEETRPIDEFLGWTDREYRQFVADPDAIPVRHYDDWEAKTLSWDQLAEMICGDWDVPCAVFHWETRAVYLTRQEAEDYGRERAYNYPDGWQVYALCARGELREALADGTEGTLKLNG